MNWYILFVRTGKEEKIKKFIHKSDKDNFFKPFIPINEILFKSKGFVKKIYKPLFPGYVFIESCLENIQFKKYINHLLRTTSDIVKVLRYSDSWEYKLKKDEIDLLLDLSNDNYCIKKSKGFIDGNNIIITDGPLKGYENIIKKINRHKRQVEIIIPILGDQRRIKVSLDIFKKI